MNSLNEIAKWLTDRDDILIQGHVSPDGDTCGSCIALAMALRALGKKVQLYIPGGVPRMYDFMNAQGVFSGDAKPEYTYAAAVDVSDKKRLGQWGEPLFDAARDTALIDHHGTNPGFGRVSYVDGSKGACAQIVRELIKLLGVPLTKEMADWLFIGISTDTGNMNYSNTAPDVLRDAAACLDAGTDAEYMTRRLYRTRSLGRTRLLGLALARLEIHGRVSCAAVTGEMFREAGALLEDTEGIVNYLQEIEGIDIAILAAEKAPGEYKLSLRSAPGIDVAKKVAIPMGGGGHMNAAGCTVYGTARQALDQALALACGAEDEA